MNRTNPIKLINKNSEEKIEETKQNSSKVLKDIDESTFENVNDFVVVTELSKNGSMTRSELVQVTNIPRTTIYDALDRLILDGYVRKYSKKSGGRGRPKVYFDLAFELK